jgi:hypothetical protein
MPYARRHPLCPPYLSSIDIRFLYKGLEVSVPLEPLKLNILSQQLLNLHSQTDPFHCYGLKLPDVEFC